MAPIQTRRHFLTAMGLAGAAGLIQGGPALATEGPPETAAIRLAKIPGICIAPQYLADELLRAEGFSEIQYVPIPTGIEGAQAMARGEVDFSLNFAAPLIIPMDAGAPVTVIAGVHVGCFELFGGDGIRSIVDLKGKSVGVQGLGTSPHVFLAAMAAHVGLDPAKDIRWVVKPTLLSSRWTCSRRGKLTPFWAFRQSRRSCAPAISAM